ncbi:WhiB family transcriptional regulator [Planobispora takensis]|uniref:Transcriptional regulator WhiB n=1 Tax=Planobispora takensis TaxID=1367882 RepID=A0A8J3SVP1_9ACTN|nr:WhiB family transcriptional regulator [Planobispora takensis]GII01499.1 transcriptional regulator WhiB [Planobispora takensis]
MSSHTDISFITHWSRQAACLSEDPELFFPISPQGPGQMQHEHAKAVCRRCPVRAQCLDYAVSTRQMHGVWGGTSPDERTAAALTASRQKAAI